MENPTNFTTPRLFIEPLSAADADFILTLLNTDGWLTFIGDRNINNREDALAYIERINKNKKIIYWTVKLTTTNAAIGLVTLIKRDYLEYHDIGFAFLPAYLHKGYAHEATATVLVQLVKQNIITHILAETLPENTGSIKLLQKLGLRFHKEMQVEQQTLFIFTASARTLLRVNAAFNRN